MSLSRRERRIASRARLKLVQGGGTPPPTDPPAKRCAEMVKTAVRMFRTDYPEMPPNEVVAVLLSCAAHFCVELPESTALDFSGAADYFFGVELRALSERS